MSWLLEEALYRRENSFDLDTKKWAYQKIPKTLISTHLGWVPVCGWIGWFMWSTITIWTERVSNDCKLYCTNERVWNCHCSVVIVPIRNVSTPNFELRSTFFVKVHFFCRSVSDLRLWTPKLLINRVAHKEMKIFTFSKILLLNYAHK